MWPDTFLSKCMHNPKLGYFCNFTKSDNHPIGKSSSNLVALLFFRQSTKQGKHSN
jgi:hypothetical protein